MIITCGYPRDYEKSLELSKKYENIYLALGLHPIDISKMNDEEIKNYLNFIKKHKDDIVAVGEIGLDYHWFEKEKSGRFRQIFIECLKLAKEINKPVVLHTRKAEEECFDIVREMGMNKVDFHCYSGSVTLARKIIDAGYYISLTTNIKNSKNAEDIAKKFPIERLLTETDSPFLSPVPGKQNIPQNVKIVIEEIAEQRKMKFEDVDKITTENAVKFFNLSCI
jgi:TatD DNase family protein